MCFGLGRCETLSFFYSLILSSRRVPQLGHIREFPVCCTLMMQMYNLNYSFQRKRIYVIIHLTLISISIAIHIIIKEYICNN